MWLSTISILKHAKMLPIKQILQLWAFIIVTCEILVFFLLPMYQSWNSSLHHISPSHSPESRGKYILLVADMQLSDLDSYHIRTRPITDLFLFAERNYAKRTYYASMRQVIASVFRITEQWWLGDYWDWTLAMKPHVHDEFAPLLWKLYGGRHESILKKSIIVAGNHDIGTIASTIGAERIERAKQMLGLDSFHGYLDYADEKVRVVWINSAHLMPDNGAYGRHLSQEAWNFIFQMRRTPLPGSEWKTVLLSHIPLYRHEDNNCFSPFQHHSSISFSMGFNYRNLLTPQETRDLLDALRPSVVLSGDHHFICKYNHTKEAAELPGEWPPAGMIVPEHTLASAGLLSSNTFPSVGVIHLPSLRVQDIFLPPTVAFHMMYGVFWVLVLVIAIAECCLPTIRHRVWLCSRDRAKQFLGDTIKLASGGLGLYFAAYAFWESYLGFMENVGM